jgi:hypothetical protein
MKIMPVFLLLLIALTGFAQRPVYTVANLHSHNDYEKPFPFWEAYSQGFGSIEADIFLQGNNLLIAHDTIQVKLGKTLDSFYLQPLQQCIQKNNGYPYANPTRSLQLLIADTDYPSVFEVIYPGNATNGQFFRRFLYPVVEQTLNTNSYKAAVARQGADLFLTKIWWDK